MDPAANGSYYGVTLDAIVDSSMSYYDQYKNQRPTVVTPYNLRNLGENGLGTRFSSGHLRLTGLVSRWFSCVVLVAVAATIAFFAALLCFMFVHDAWFARSVLRQRRLRPTEVSSDFKSGVV